MKGMLSTKSNSFLFLVISFLMVSDSFVAKGQTKSTSPNLMNTVWKIPNVDFDTSLGRATSTCLYYFQKDGRVGRREMAMLQSQLQAIPNYQNPMFNPQVNAWAEGSDPTSLNSPNRLVLSATPAMLVQIDEVGTYTVKGDSMTMDFAGNCKNCTPHSITATIQNDLMDAEYLNNKTNRKSAFKIVRMSNVVNQKPGNINKDSGECVGDCAIRASQQLIREESDKNIRDEEAKRRNGEGDNPSSSLLSLSEFQINYFKPKPLTKTIVSGITPKDKLVDTNFYSFPAGGGEVTITIILTARQDSFADSASIQLQDRNNNILVEKFVTTSRGRTDSAVTSVNISAKQIVLLRIMVSGGGASYEVHLDGAVEIGQPGS